MSLSVFYNNLYLALFSVIVTVSTDLCVSYFAVLCPCFKTMSRRNFTLTGPH